MKRQIKNAFLSVVLSPLVLPVYMSHKRRAWKKFMADIETVSVEMHEATIEAALAEAVAPTLVRMDRMIEKADTMTRMFPMVGDDDDEHIVRSVN